MPPKTQACAAGFKIAIKSQTNCRVHHFDFPPCLSCLPSASSLRTALSPASIVIQPPSLRFPSLSTSLHPAGALATGVPALRPVPPQIYLAGTIASNTTIPLLPWPYLPITYT
uniref:Uncharacterized protein n=1 Tax=Bionectria ochroleuca TaxID=29856 RepID=A0A8H7NDA3_BIOOC